MDWLAIRNWLMVRQGECRIVLYLAGLAMLVGGGLAIGRGSSDALFFKRFGTQYLPHMFFATSFLLVITSMIYAQVADRWSPGKVLVTMSAAVACLLGVNWLIMQFGTNPYAYVFYFLIYAVVSEILLVHFSFFVSSFFHVQQSKRLSPLVNAASRLGAVVGGLALGGLVQIWPAPSLALVWAVTLLVIVAMVVWKSRGEGAGAASVKRKASKQGGGMLNAFFFARRSALLKITGLGAFLLIILISLQDYIVATLLTRHFVEEKDLTAFFGIFFACSNALVLVMQMAVTSRLLQRFGLRAVNLIFPLSTLLTFSLLAISPGVVTATLARFNYTGMLPAFRNPAANLFYSALPAYMQGRARAFILGLVLPAGLAVAGLGLMFVPVRMVDSWLPIIGTALAVAFVIIKIRKNAAYSEALTELIQQQVFSEKSPILDKNVCMDDRVARKLAESITSAPDPESALAFVDILGEYAPKKAGPLLLEIAPRSNVKVQDRILRWLVILKPDGWQAYAKQFLDHEDLHICSTSLEVLAKVNDPEAILSARRWMDQDKARPRAAALTILKNAVVGIEHDEASSRLLAMLNSTLPQENIAAAEALSLFRDASMIDSLKPLLASRDARVRATAVHAYSELGQLAGRDCAEEVKAAMFDETETVRVAAVKSISAIHSGSVRLSLLAQALDDHSPAVRRTAMAEAPKIFPDSAESLANAFTDYFHHFGMQVLLAEASRKLDMENRDALLDEMIRRHLDVARQKSYAAVKIVSSNRAASATAKVLREALKEEVRGHVCTAMDMLAEKIPGEGITQAANALRSLNENIRAQGLESLQCLSANQLAREIAELADQPELRVHNQDRQEKNLREVLAAIAPQSTAWLQDCVAAFLGEAQENGLQKYAV